MDSRYRKFLALAQAGSFSAAARSLHVTQPAISLAITSLEHTLKVRLYVRRSRPIVLTPEGQIVAEATRIMVAEQERMLTALHAQEPAENMRVGLIDSIARLLYESDAGQPLLQNAEVMVDNSHRILRALRENRIDLGIITGQPTALGPELIAQALQDEEFVFVGDSARVHTETPDRVDDWLATNPDSTTYRYFLRLFERAHLQVTPVFHSASMELLRDMAVAGKGTALLPRHIVKMALASGSLNALPLQPIGRPLWAVMRREQPLVTAELITARVNSLLTSDTIER